MDNKNGVSIADKMKDYKQYQFEWCPECAYLKGCYYPNKYFQNHPNFLEPDCANGPARQPESPPKGE